MNELCNYSCGVDGYLPVIHVRPEQDSKVVRNRRCFLSIYQRYQLGITRHPERKWSEGSSQLLQLNLLFQGYRPWWEQGRLDYLTLSCTYFLDCNKSPLFYF